MAKIIAPNKSYTGVSASVAFCNGEGNTDDKHLIKWFKDHGYTVEEPASETVDSTAGTNTETSIDLNTMTVEQLTAYAQEKGIDIGQATTQAGILKKIQDATTTPV